MSTHNNNPKHFVPTKKKNMMKEDVTYNILDNGGSNFELRLDNKRKFANVFLKELDEKGDLKERKKVFGTKFSKAFIGESGYNELTSGGGGDSAEPGSSVLLHLKGLNYVWVGQEIFEFQAKAKIDSFQSDVGNNGVPYPYAIDEKKNTYLMLEKKVLPPSVEEGR